MILVDGEDRGEKQMNSVAFMEEEALLEAKTDSTVLPGFRPSEDSETIRARNEERTTSRKIEL